MIKNFWYALIRFLKPLFTEDPLILQYEQRLRDKDHVISSQALIIASKEDKIRELYEEFINTLSMSKVEAPSVPMPSPISMNHGWSARRSRLESIARNRKVNEETLTKIAKAESEILDDAKVSEETI